jgi:hypothetical protein
MREKKKRQDRRRTGEEERERERERRSGGEKKARKVSRRQKTKGLSILIFNQKIAYHDDCNDDFILIYRYIETHNSI